MIDKAFIEKIVELRDEGQYVTIEGQAYSAKGLVPVIFEPRAKTLCVDTLSGLIAFIKNNIDELKFPDLYIHVEGPKKVSLISALLGKNRQRETFLSAELDSNMQEFPFGKYMAQEEFIIRLRALFVSSPDVERLISYTSRLSAGTTITQEDDGITQTATVKKGASGAITKEETAPVIVGLKPYRSFREIDQVQSQFLFRIKAGGDGKPECALFEADGGTWRNSVVLAIRDYLTNEANGIPVIA